MEDPATHEEDPTHPIPFVDVIDVRAVKKGAGAHFIIVIAAPLQADRRSLQRLVQKMRNYLGYIASEQSRVECGPPAVENTEVEVHIHPDSSPGVLSYLEKCHDWFTDNHATLVITPKGPALADRGTPPRSPAPYAGGWHGSSLS